MTEPIIFTGATTLSQKSFTKHYVPELEKAIAAKMTIRVGCASGSDTLVQEFCKDKGYFDLEVYVPSEENPEKVRCASEHFKRIDVQGGFKNRDRVMWRDCKQAYAHLSQYGGAGSGAAANLIACAARAGQFGPECVNLDGYAIVDVLRRALAQFQPELQKTVLEAEAAADEK